MEVVLSRSGNEGLSQEPAYQQLKAEGWMLEMAFLVRGADQVYDQYHLTLRRPLRSSDDASDTGDAAPPPPSDAPPAPASPD